MKKVKVVGADSVNMVTVYGYEVRGGEPAAEPSYETTMDRSPGVWNEVEEKVKRLEAKLKTKRSK